MLRQQEVDRRRQAEPVARRLHRAASSSGVPDYLGAFAVTAGLGADELVAQLRAAITTTTTRSWSRRWPTASPRRSPSTCTRRRARTGATASSEQLVDRGPHRREVPRHPPGLRLSRLPGSQREVQAVRAARGAEAGHRADRARRDDAGGQRQRPLLRAPAGEVLQRRPDRARSGRSPTRSARASPIEEVERWLAPNLAYDPAAVTHNGVKVGRHRRRSLSHAGVVIPQAHLS